MVSKKEFKKAQEIINDYKSQINKLIIKDHICMCCKTKEIKHLDELIIPDATKQEDGWWDGGVVEKITFGYGSRHDMRSFYVAICDDCIQELEKSGLAIDVKEIIKKENEYGL